MPYFPSVTEVKNFRIKLEIKQHELAKKIGVSTNMITQIETGRAKPSAENYIKIFEYLYEKSSEKDKKLEEIWTTPIISLRPTQTAHDAKEIFDNSKFDIELLPVLTKDNHLVGKITKQNLESHLQNSNRPADTIIINDILEESPPTAPYYTPKTWIKEFIQSHKDCVLVTKHGKIMGFVNYWDYLYK